MNAGLTTLALTTVSSAEQRPESPSLLSSVDFELAFDRGDFSHLSALSGGGRIGQARLRHSASRSIKRLSTIKENLNSVTGEFHAEIASCLVECATRRVATDSGKITPFSTSYFVECPKSQSVSFRVYSIQQVCSNAPMLCVMFMFVDVYIERCCQSNIDCVLCPFDSSCGLVR